MAAPLGGEKSWRRSWWMARLRHTRPDLRAMVFTLDSGGGNQVNPESEKHIFPCFSRNGVDKYRAPFDRWRTCLSGEGWTWSKNFSMVLTTICISLTPRALLLHRWHENKLRCYRHCFLNIYVSPPLFLITCLVTLQVLTFVNIRGVSKSIVFENIGKSSSLCMIRILHILTFLRTSLKNVEKILFHLLCML